MYLIIVLPYPELLKMEAIGDAVLALIPVAIIAYAVVTRDKTVGALVQMGGLQGRQYANDSLASQARLTAAKVYGLF